MRYHLDFHPHAGQVYALERRNRFNVWSFGRRFGKSFMAYPLLIEGISKGVPVAYVTPAADDYVKRWLEFEEMYHRFIRKVIVSDGIMIMRNGQRLDWFGMHRPEGIRGNKYGRVVIDEAAYGKNLMPVWKRTIRATVTDFKGDMYIMSTPDDPGSDFHQLFLRGQDPKRPKWSSLILPTSMNPYIDPEEIEQARQDMTELEFRREYLGEFVDLSGSVVRPEMVRHVDMNQIPAGVKWFVGVDLAISQEMTADRTAIAVCGVDWDNGGTVYVPHVTAGRWGLYEAAEHIEAVAKAWDAKQVYVEDVGYQRAMSEHLLRTTGAAVRPIKPEAKKEVRAARLIARYERGLVAHVRGRVDDYERELFSFPNPKVHDDTVDAVVYAYRAAADGRTAKAPVMERW